MIINGSLDLFMNRLRQKLIVLVVDKNVVYLIGLVKLVKIGIGVENAIKQKIKHMLIIKENTNYT